MSKPEFSQIIKNTDLSTNVEFVTGLFTQGLSTKMVNLNYEDDYYISFKYKDKKYYLPYSSIIGLILDGGKNND